MKKLLLAMFACAMLVTAFYAANAGKSTVDTASTACYYVISVTDSQGNPVDGMRYLGSDLGQACVSRANADLANYQAMYPAKEGYTVTLSWPELWSGPRKV